MGVGFFGFDGHQWKNTRKHVNSMLYLGVMYTLVIFRVRGPGDGVRRIKIKRTLAYAFKILFVEPWKRVGTDGQ